ncbi:hypothetical protein EVAR_59673_1 [Eumeta japonica]|uniref:Uncharacterized protein n=1 Tax=Eumeta variegata TaxID=151549 RepID=A0A4C1Z3V5_EUMVA|nr:hypothetical protein EVAR_59673_1 [Eumeta japonica]
MSSRDRDAGRKFESAENIPSTSSWVPPPSSSKNSEDDDELTTSLSFRSSVPPSTLSSQEHESELESTSTSMTVGMENLNPQNDPEMQHRLVSKQNLFLVCYKGCTLSLPAQVRVILVTAREIAEENDIDRHFKKSEDDVKKRHFDYEGEDETHELNAEEIFKINYFYVIVDNVRASCHPRVWPYMQLEPPEPDRTCSDRARSCVSTKATRTNESLIRLSISNGYEA